MKITLTNPAIINNKLPQKALGYIKTHYPAALIIDVTEDFNKPGEVKYYDVEMIESDMVYHIRFDNKARFVYEMGENSTDTNVLVQDSDESELKECSVTDEVIDEF